MKKMILLCTMICASQLHGMEEMIKKVKEGANFHLVNVGEFTTIIASMMVRFPNATKNITREEIARMFDAPVALEYIEVNSSFIFKKILGDTAANRLNYLRENIDNLDPNYTYKINNNWSSMLGAAYKQALYERGNKNAIDVIQLLLENRANPHVKEGQSGTLLEKARMNRDTLKTDFGLYNLLNQ